MEVDLWLKRKFRFKFSRNFAIFFAFYEKKKIYAKNAHVEIDFCHYYVHYCFHVPESSDLRKFIA
jgi:hypothetical protein